MEGQFKKGVLEMCILFLISQKDMYGYEIMKKLKHHFHDVSDASIYAILRRLAMEKYTEVYLGSVSGGPTRKYYKITNTGDIYLQKALEQWNILKAAVQEVGIS